MIQPPFRAEHIGSLLRPASLLDLRRRHAAGQASAQALKAAEDEAIREAVALQERVGLRVATDGEFRRASYHSFFYSQLGRDIQIDSVEDEPKDSCCDDHAPTRGAQPVAKIRSRVQWTHPIHVEDFRVLKALTRTATPKITIPGPCALHFRGGDAAVLATAYKDTDSFWADTVEAFGKELQALADAGCTYIQIDETAFAKFGDPAVQATLKARGEDWQETIDRYIAVTNRVLAAAPRTLRIGMHLCRGNRAGQFHAEGGYDVVADKLFNALNIGFYFLEYDSPRAGDYAPLRFVPPSKSVILGLVSTKTTTVENRDELKARIEAATQFVALDRLCISPQCGFASVDIGNPISVQVQEDKLRLLVELAKDIWADA